MLWAWLGALLIGLTLGLLGSGGSILTVQVLVYVVGEPDKLAIAESLGIVMLISLVGAIPFALEKKVDWRSVFFFGVPGMAGAFLGAVLSQFMPGAAQLMLFAVVMLAAAVMMFRRVVPAEPNQPRHAAWKIILEGLGVGILTGLVGIGGGFLIVPALVLLGGLSIHLAVGTSLAIIALKSVSGFVKYIDLMEQAGTPIHWNLVLLFAAIGIVGSLIGRRAGKRVPQQMLSRAFAVFLVVMGVVMLWQNASGLT